MKKILLITFALIISLLPASFASAADLRADNTNIDISEKESVKDLYLFSDNIIVNAPVAGDLTTMGGSVIINGNTENSLFALGENVAIRGSVTRHLRIAASSITLSGNIGGDVFLAANTINITSDAVIGGDLYAAANTLTINGTVKGTTKVGGKDVSIGGTIASATVRATNLNVNAGASLKNGLVYYSPTTANIHSNATVTGAVDYHKIDNKSFNKIKGLFGFGSLMIFIGSFLLMLVLIKLFRPTIQKLIDSNNDKFFPGLGIGFLGLFIVPIALIILAFSIVGLPFAGVGALVWILALAASSLLGKLFLGSWIYKTVRKQNDYVIDYKTALIGLIAGSIIGIIPVVGGLITLVIFLVSLGSMIVLAKTLRS